jgi:hypothetical protein
MLQTPTDDASRRSLEEASHHVQDLVLLLQDMDNLALARLVIPELRSGAKRPQSLTQKIVVDGIAASRAGLRAIDETCQEDYDQPLYTSEKRIFQEAEMYRASIMLFNSGSLDKEETEKVGKWMEACPVRTTVKQM